MHFEKRYEEALQHIEQAGAFLLGATPSDREDQAPEEFEAEREGGRRAVLDHIAAARRELKGLQKEAGQEENLQGEDPQGENSRGKSGDGPPHELSGDRRPTNSKLAGRVMGLLTVLTGQMEVARQALGPLRPSGDRRPPLQRFREADIEAVLSALRRLQRPASAMEASLRRLQNRLRDGGAPPT